MHPPVALLLTFAWASCTLAQTIVDNMSFGQGSRISSSSFNIPNWLIHAESHEPQIFSNKVVLTPPYGPDKSAGIWAEKTNQLQDWQVDFEFRVGLADRGSGHLQFWYAKDGGDTVGTRGIYHVGKFDGLALVIDTLDGVQKIRGFLNDGSVDYSNHAGVDGLAFGHCDYQYRHQGDPSRLQVKSTGAGLEVLVDGRGCFSSQQVTLPTNYSFGTTAISGDPPDSYEIFKFIVSSAPSPPPASGTSHKQPSTPPRNPSPMTGSERSPPVIDNDFHPASYYTTSETQFADLHNRLNLVSKAITNLFAEISKHTKAEEDRYQEILRAMPNAASLAKIDSLDSRIQKLDRVLSSLESEIKNSDHSGQFSRLSEQIAQTHRGVTEHVPERLREYVQAHTPRIGFILYSFMAFQTCCIGAFAWYKYRKSTMPKKYL